MQVNRTPPARRRRGSMTALGCIATAAGCVLVTGLALVGSVLLFRDELMTLGLQQVGFETAGQTEAVFAEPTPNIAPIPTVTNATAPQTFTLREATTGNTQAFQNNAGVDVAVGSSTEGDVATVTTNEAELVALCHEYSTVCSPEGITESGYTIRNATVDLRPGGAIVSASVTGEGIPFAQSVGVVLTLNESGDSVDIRGVDINGQLLSAPPPEFQPLLDSAQAELDAMLAAGVIEIAGETYRLDRITIDETSITALLK
ncbi:MAG: hypothetical protein AAF125_05175 [Chloroflexota bacterium]